MIPMDRQTKLGFALPAAIFALVIIGTLVTGGFFLARQQTRIGQASERGSDAFYLAERGAMETIADWDLAAFGGRALWNDTTRVDTVDDGVWAVSVTRMSSRSYFLLSTGTVLEGEDLLGSATRTLGLIVRTTTLELSPLAALTTRGDADLRGNAEVHGEDVYPPGWAGYCSNTLEDKPGILIDAIGNVSSGGASEYTGAPPALEDPSLNDSTFLKFGDTTWDDLVAMADIRLPGGNINNTFPDSTAAGVCLSGSSHPTNWGNPLNPGAACGDWFPIIHVNGTARIQSGGVGQGILLVEGDLDLRGNFTFRGIVIVQGNFETQGSGNRVMGGVLASNADFEDQSVTGGSEIQYSRCAAARAVENNSSLTRVRPIGRRSWVDLSSAVSG